MNRRMFMRAASVVPLGAAAIAMPGVVEHSFEILKRDGFRHTMDDWGGRYLMLYLNGEPFKYGNAVDTAAGIIYGVVHFGNTIPAGANGHGPGLWIYRGKVELRVDETRSAEMKAKAQAYLDAWAKVGGTPIDKFNKFIEPWRSLREVM